MEVYNSEEEQVQAIKQWWKENAVSIIAGIVLGLGGILGYQYWGSQKVAQAATASELYEQASIAKTTEEKTRITLNLSTEFSGTPYASLAMLELAKVNVEEKKLTDAINNLKWVLDNGDDGIKHIARQRLARVYIAKNEIDSAEALLQGMTEKAYEADYAEIKGDISRARKQYLQARENYKIALAALNQADQRYPVIKMKLDDLAISSAAK